MKRSIFTLILALYTLPSIAQQADSLILEGKALLNEAVNMSDLDGLKRAQNLFQRASNDASMATHANYYLGLAEYRMAAFSEGDAVIQHLDNGIEYLEAMLNKDANSVEGNALLSSLYGWKAGLKPMKAMVLGPRSDKHISVAENIAPENPRVWVVKAISSYSKPKMFGGDKDVALEGFQKALELFEQQDITNPLAPSWGHLDSYAWMGIIYMEKGQNAEAKSVFEKALAIDPEYGWIKYGLMPQLVEN